MSDPAGTPVYSEFASDAEMRELIEMFVSELPVRVNELQRAFQAANLGELTRFAHQMKGAAPGYGFGSMGQAAAALERAVADGADLERVRDDMDALIGICQRARL